MPAPIGICPLCDERVQLAESHILPEFFYERTYDETGRFISVSSHPRHRPRPMQRGLTERLLCVRCEGSIGRYETYAARLLRRIDEEWESSATAQRGVALNNVDLRSFRLFGLSVLWRMHESRQHMFGAVRLGPRADRLKALVRAADPGPPYEFGFVLAKIVGLGTHGDMIMAPTSHRFRGCRSYLMMARGFDWVFSSCGHSAALVEYMPFVGSTPTLHVPTIQHDKETLFENIRRAFPDSIRRR